MLSNHQSSFIPFSSSLQSCPALGSFQMSHFFTSGGQSIGVSALASVLPMNIQDWFPLGWTGFDLLSVQGTLKSLLQHHSSKASILRCSAFFIVQLSHPFMTTGKRSLVFSILLFPLFLFIVLHSVWQHIWKTWQRPHDWKRSVFIPIPKKGNAKECSNHCIIALSSHASKVILKVLQARLQQYVN